MSLDDLKDQLNKVAMSEGLTLQVNQAGNHLSIVMNRAVNKTVEYNQIADQLMDELRSLELPNINSVKLYGRQAGANKPEWQEIRPLITPTPTPSPSWPAKSLPVQPKTHEVVSATPLSRFSPRMQLILNGLAVFRDVIVTGALSAILAILLMNTLAGQKSKPVVWEYRIETVPDLAFTETMNQLGGDGWELVFARRAQDSATDQFSYECIFKRMKR